ncbi:unnamed protein product [Polarella glacialis]|uniref:AAA+ ATPase domain-containing protein n=1 Tax=Polarella glacialis TaxID=89957 RepID=A0A813HEP4_POLGL|nr:unnamed protein product [Polarella glacialis]
MEADTQELFKRWTGPWKVFALGDAPEKMGGVAANIDDSDMDNSSEHGCHLKRADGTCSVYTKPIEARLGLKPRQIRGSESASSEANSLAVLLRDTSAASPRPLLLRAEEVPLRYRTPKWFQIQRPGGLPVPLVQGCSQSGHGDVIWAAAEFCAEALVKGDLEVLVGPVRGCRVLEADYGRAQASWDRRVHFKELFVEPTLRVMTESAMGLQTENSKPHEEDLYMKLKELKRQMEFLDIQEEYIKDEMKNLKRESIRAQEEIKRVQSVPLVIGQFSEMIDKDRGIVSSTAGSNYFVRILSTLNREMLKPSSSVALHRHSHAVVDILPPEADSTVQSLAMSEKPDVTYSDIGGMDIQKQEIREAVEMALTHAELYAQIGIDPPSGVLLYGPPGTGKTMLAKAVANHTTATFIRMVGSEFVQKYLGEGPRMVRDVFRLARENAPSIVFIDEIDAIGTKRFDSQTGADREVQRILLELLNQMDGFDQDNTVKVIMATNRADTLDPALLRPGRLDRKIEFPLPDRRQKRLIFQTITAKMNLSEEVDLEDYVSRPEKISCADIAAICQEAGMQAVRHNRYIILPKDFESGWKDHAKKKDTEFDFYG